MFSVRLRLFSRVLTSVSVKSSFLSRNICTAEVSMAPTLKVTNVSDDGKSLCLLRGDKSYFDFKELECNASAGQRLSHFVALMCEVFQLSEEEAEHVVKYYPFLWKEFIHKSFSQLKALDLDKDMFLRYPWLVTITPEDIAFKQAVISKTFPDLENINMCAILYKFPNRKLETLVHNWKEEALHFEYPSKFHYLAKALKVPISEIMCQLEAKKFLMSFPFSRIQDGVNTCLQAGVTPEDLFKDLWILRNRLSKLQNRIETLQQQKIPVRPWVLRARIKSFETHIREYWEAKKDMEIDIQLAPYLAARLKRELPEIEKLIKAYPKLKNASLGKLKPKLDYLIEEKGLDPSLIMMTPRVLCQKFETVKGRLERLEAAGIECITSLWIVCKTQEEFDRFVQRWKTTNS